jgi:AGZA family xanthine/uracil permease-like MFS transporter
VRWLVRGDVDGFFGLALDNLVQLLLIDALCRSVLGMPPDLLYGRILPGAAVSLLVGNLFYAWQATPRDRPRRRLRAALRDQHRVAFDTSSSDAARKLAEAAGAADWCASRQAGLVACLDRADQLACAPFAGVSAR